jgi:predicted nucleic-acid-binding Zn-ribbon protein
MKCLACLQEMSYLKEYKLDSQDSNRGLLGAIFDIEENLIFDIYVCPECRRTEFIYKGERKDLDWD